jgi:quercetin dioxygenase-like cupin family protein
MGNDDEQVLTLSDLFQVASWQSTLPWKPFLDGVDIYRLYGRAESGPAAALLRFHAGGRVNLHEHTGYEHIVVLAGSQVDENSKAETGALIINPPGTRHAVLSEQGCIVLAIYEKPVRFLGTTPSPPALARPRTVFLAVNGTLMRGLELNPALLAVNATFVREAATEPAYRLMSIDDRHPAMIRVKSGVAVAVEIWSVPVDGLAAILLNEPPGLTIGKVTLEDGSEVLGVIGEPILCEAQKDISSFGGWRAYTASLKSNSDAHNSEKVES